MGLRGLNTNEALPDQTIPGLLFAGPYRVGVLGNYDEPESERYGCSFVHDVFHIAEKGGL